MEKATIFNIMRYSVHDGPGIRTTVFFKGCPLRCKWCHNPESFDQKPQEIFNPNKCINCGLCTAGSLKCPTGARETIGYEITNHELMKEIQKDRLFYDESGGGVTFSGGEPLYQADFLLSILNECRKEYINTAIDTSGFAETDILLKAAALANYILFDIKFFDSNKHQKYCGAPNDLVLTNLNALREVKTRLIIRIPLIPGINDDINEMKEIFNLLSGFNNIDAVHFLPYHNIHTEKYKKIGIEYKFSDVSAEISTNKDEINKIFNEKYKTKYGG